MTDGVARLYVDSNIFIALLEAEAAARGLLAALFLSSRRDGEPFLATSELTAAETLVHPYRIDDPALIRSYGAWTRSNPFVEVAPVSRDVLVAAAQLRAGERDLKLPDAIHVASAFALGCTHMLTADTRIGPSYVRPPAFGTSGADAASDLVVVRPEPSVLRDLVRGGEAGA